MKLTYTEINFKTGMLTFNDTKAGTNRSVPMLKRTREILLNRRDQFPDRPFPYDVKVIEQQWSIAIAIINIIQNLKMKNQNHLRISWNLL